MTLREEFKISGLEAIPDTWQLIPLGKIVKEAKVRNTSRKELKVYAITKHRGLVPSLGFFTKKVYSEDLSRYKVVKRNQFAYSPIHLNEGAIGLLEEESEGLVSPLHIVFELLPPANPQFFKYLLKSHRLLSTYVRLPLGSVKRRGAVRFGDFSKIIVQLPSELEQHKITSILSTVDEAIQKTNEIIAKTQQLKKGLMQQLLVRGIGHHRLKQTEIGKIPENWVVAKLCDVLVEPIKNGYSPRAPPKETGKWILTLGALSSEGLEKDKIKPAPINDLNVTRCELKPGDILVSRSNTRQLVGLAALYRGEPPNCSYPDLMMRVRVDRTRIDNVFLVHWLRSPFSRKYLTSSARGTSGSMVKINRTILSELQIPLPPSTEQGVIVARLSAIDEKLANEHRVKEKLGQLKNGLMQVLLTGRVRVKVN